MLCLGSVVSTRALNRINLRRAVVRRQSWLRLFAALVALLGLLAQQRVLTPVVRPSASVARLVAERVQSIETHAVRVEPGLRVAAAPVFARLPPFPQPIIPAARFRVSGGSAPAPDAGLHGPLGHFHTQRRIPRMNSEEPPRV